MSNRPRAKKVKSVAIKRKRRSKDDIVVNIREAAQQLFAERGYAATTTREIARVADVSETLLFRYYGTKEGLFDDVVSAPFNELMREFIQSYGNSPDPQARVQSVHSMYSDVYELFDQNRLLFSALMSAQSSGIDHNGDQSGAAPLTGLAFFFDQALRQMNLDYAKTGRRPEFDPEIGVRLGFGMIAAAVLMRDWLFPDGAPSKKAMIKALENMIGSGLMSHGLD